MASDVTGTFGTDPNQKYLTNNTDTSSSGYNPKASYTGAPKVDGKEWNVHGEYNWALNLGPNNGDIRNYIPKIELVEYDLTSSSQLNAYKLFLSQAQDQLDIANIGRTGILGQNNTVTSNIASLINNGVLPSGSVDKYLGPNNGVANPGGFSNADPYYGLYQGTLTNNKYYLPYLNPQNMTSNLGTWKGIDGSNVAKDVSNVAADKLGGLQFGPTGSNIVAEFQTLGLKLDAINSVANVASSLNAPGISKETIKAFAPNDTGDSIVTTFYLFNTQDQAQMASNWNFLFTLTYQNLPNRKSLSRMDPPCIYTVTVPGFKRFPVAVITGLKVDNVGTTRLVDITTGEMMSVDKATNNKNVKIVPEAYRVTVTIQSLLTNSRNLFYYNYDPKGTGANIQVITSPDTNNISNQELTNTLNQYQKIAENAKIDADAAAEALNTFKSQFPTNWDQSVTGQNLNAANTTAQQNLQSANIAVTTTQNYINKLNTPNP